MNKNFQLYHISTTPFNPDLLSGILWELEPSGIEEREESIVIYFDASSEIKAADLDEVLQELIDDNIFEEYTITKEQIEEKNWNEEWEKTLTIKEIGEKIVIKPSHLKYNNTEDKIILTIDPKMSFGTGDHESTKLMLMAIEKYVKPDMNVLDVGTGTGILAIAALKLGAKEALGIDVDEWCIENGKENAERNDVADQFTISLTELTFVERYDFDVIFANIQRNILLDLPSELSKRLKPGGFLLLSGLLNTDEQDIISAYEVHNLKHNETSSLNEWIGLVFQKQ